MNLNQEAIKYAKDVWKKKRNLVRQNKHYKHKKTGRYTTHVAFEPPAVVCACSYKNKSEFGYSDEPRESFYLKAPELHDSLTHIKPDNLLIGKVNTICNNVIGRCAEPHAACRVLMHYSHKQPPISALNFSKAIRPRTKSIIPPCYNCKEVFHQL